MHELTPINIPDFLVERGWISSPPLRVEELSGGVSNVVYRVQTAKGWFVLKQSRSQLRTVDPWFSDIARIVREMDVMEVLSARLPTGMVPKIFFRDNANFAFLMEHAPREAQDWRSILLAGKVEPARGETAGAILGAIHDSTFMDPVLRERFGDKVVFDQLRLDPFYRRVIPRCPEVANTLQRLIQEAESTEVCLVHGDFSPKNLLQHDAGFTLVDYETAHFGDPGFDLGFFLSHLFLKALMHPEQFDTFQSLLARFWQGYQSRMRGRPLEPLLLGGMGHLCGCLLARVDGTSPAPYLTEERRRTSARRLAKKLLLENPTTWDEPVEWLRAECNTLRDSADQSVRR